MDRNWQSIETPDSVSMVALRKESVDRNWLINKVNGGLRAVALRKESVDRNTDNYISNISISGRSPQGERG